MSKISIELPTTITVAMGKDSGDRLNVETKRLAANVLTAIVVAGVKVILTNAYNGGGKETPHAEKVSAASKKLDAWYRGEFNVVARGDSMLTAMREAYVDDVRAKTGASVRDVEQSIKATVAKVFGEKESATFGRFLDALALLLAKQEHGDKPSDEQVSAIREAVEAKYMGLADEAAKRRSDAAAKIDVTGLALADFKKA